MTDDAVRPAGLRRLSLTSQATEAIIRMIIDEGLQPGDALPPSLDLAERLDVSRTVIREALAELGGRGLVSRPGGRATMVANPGAEQLQEVFGFRLRRDDVHPATLMELRLVVEVGTARLAAERRTDEHVALLERSVERLRGASGEPAFTAIDIEFHQHIAAASGNLLFQLLIESLGGLFAEFRSRSYHNLERRGTGFEQIIREHRRVVDAVSASEPDAAGEAMAAHIHAVGVLLAG